MPTPNIPSPQTALLASILTYPLLFALITPFSAPALRFTKSREAISVLHCSLVTFLSAWELHSQSSAWNISPNHHLNLENKKEKPGTNCALITTHSPVGNSIMAFELGYLLQDSVILVLAARLRARGAGGKAGGMAKEIDWRVLGWHHAGISSALAVLQWYIARGKEKGILVILMLMLMNASSPMGTLHWYLVNFQPSRKHAIMLANAAYLLVYGMCRVVVVPWILHVFGSQAGYSTFEAFRSLRMACQLGTATIGISNLTWFVLGVRKFGRRYWGNDGLRKGI